ncbi:phosphatidylglycerol lysyltransferase domain-containing protein [Bythopirellula polymerisocia]|uniref:Phosphatidylglycerol lysyltransferase n=1 Tax=Bythopirellula polymerisocia TaxID=2528003 RepID=A0A5C6D2C6_9BACT|nr:phosphatidylglycerol lysyltransferase domain-containing protein [Bythopirellula polymerisocia]TWU30285.1 Phosphatidylglycerol lysyltransferase [Bythopirellula polymerisocia]
MSPGTSENASAADQQRRLQLVRQFGTFTQAYSTAVQPELEYFWHGEAYLAFRRKWGITCVLADPVGKAELHGPLLAAFTKKFPKNCFWQISRETATLLQEQGFWINEMGCDTRLELANYDFAGKQKERLRHATNWLAKHNYKVREGAFAQDVSQSEIRRLSEQWQAERRTTRDVYFFNRPIVYADEVDVRKFFLFSPSGQPVAFIFFDPIYRDGNVVGYSPAIKRRLSDAPLRAEEGIMKVAIEQFQREEIERVMLGLSPMAGITDREFRANPLIHFSWSRALNAWWINRYFYNLAGHADFKRRFDGLEEQTYYASKCLFNDVRVVASLKLAGAL